MYLATTNVWALLHDEAEEDKQIKQINVISAQQSVTNTKSNKWTHQIERRRTMKLVIDSGATSNFVPEEINMPKKGKSNKEVYLPDNTKLQASYWIKLPLEQLSHKAREADILPGLKNPRQRQQNVWRGIHNYLPSGKRGGDNPQAKDSLNSNDGITHSPRV